MNRRISESDTKNRIVFIDYVRAMAILMVIMCHVLDINCMFWLGYQEMSVARQTFLYALLAIGRCGVPLFLLITGYLLLDRDYGDGRWAEFYTKRWLHLLAVTEIWFMIYEVFSCTVQGNPFHAKDFLLRILMVQEPVLAHAWYLPMVLKIYLIIPIISMILRKLSTKSIFVLVAGILAINTILQMMSQGSTVITEVASYVLYLSFVLAGFVIKRFHDNVLKHQPQGKRHIGLALLIICVEIISFVGCEWFLRRQYQNGDAVSLWYDNIFVVMMAIAVFGGMSLMVSKTESRAVRQLSDDSFGIYLIHNMIALTLMGILASWQISWYVKIVVSYIVILLVSVLLNKAIETIPYIGKWIVYKK